MAHKPPSQCQECGCHCDSCHNNNSLHLHQEIEDLKEKVHARELHIVQMETSVLANADKYPNGEYAALAEEMLHWQDKYDRLFENHRKLQKVNQGLEDKLLKIVDKYETEKNALNRDIANLTARLVETRISSAQLEEENEQYRNDCNIAIQLLQCKPSNFIAHRLETFPVDLQQKAKVHLNIRKNNSSNSGDNHQTNHSTEARTIRVPIPTFPPTAMVYSVSDRDLAPNGKHSTNGHDACGTVSNDIVSAAIMAKVLEERAKERSAGSGCCGVGTRKSMRCVCKCRGRKWMDVATTDSACQTQWSIPPEVSYSGWEVPSLAQSQSGNGAVGVHSQRRLDLSADFGIRRKYTRSGSSTSTETEI